MHVFLNFLYKSICRQLDAIQMGTHNICLYKDVDKKKYTGSNHKTMDLLDCALIGVCAVIRSDMVIILWVLISSTLVKCF